MLRLMSRLLPIISGLFTVLAIHFSIWIDGTQGHNWGLTAFLWAFITIVFTLLAMPGFM